MFCKETILHVMLISAPNNSNTQISKALEAIGKMSMPNIDAIEDTLSNEFQQTKSEKLQSIKIYPTIVNSVLMIDSDCDDGTLMLSDSYGERLLLTDLHFFNTIDMSDLENGLYYITVKTKCREYNEIVIKE